MMKRMRNKTKKRMESAVLKPSRSQGESRDKRKRVTLGEGVASTIIVAGLTCQTCAERTSRPVHPSCGPDSEYHSVARTDLA